MYKVLLHFKNILLISLYGIIFIISQVLAEVPTKDIQLPAIFSDNMILQQNINIPVWGFAQPGSEVSVEFRGQKKNTKVSQQGTWRVDLDPVSAGGPFELSIIGSDTTVFKNVMVGEVWLCSGQSNMEMPLAGWGKVNNFEQEIAAADYPDIRLLQVERSLSLKIQNKIPTKGWAICSPQTIPEFSSTAYFFGRYLYQKLNVPIGLIHSSWGGTIIEAWTSGKSLKKIPEFKTVVEQMELKSQDEETKYDRELLAKRYEKAIMQWYQKIYDRDAGYNDPKGTWEKYEINITGWKPMNLPTKWEKAGLQNFNGTVWFRKDIDVPETWLGNDLTLYLGPIDDIDSTYFNGIKIGGLDDWDEPRAYSIPAEIVKKGRNIIAVRVQDNHGDGGIWGEPEQLWIKFNENDSISLAGNWLYKIGVSLEQVPAAPENPLSPNRPMVLSNTMIEPLIPYAIQGVIWYQGESNAGRAYQYRTLFTTLINDWRERWNQGNFPFLFVQLANWLEIEEEPGDHDWAELREAQTMALALPYMGMAVAIDIGNANDIHPKNKQEVGRRLALNALKIAYKKDIEYSGPIYKSMTVEKDKIRITFNHLADGLIVKGDDKLKGFAIAGADKKFYWADAEIAGQEVVVSSKHVPHPVAVRYAWAANPVCNLYNSAGLPASPFRSDDLY